MVSVRNDGWGRYRRPRPGTRRRLIRVSWEPHLQGLLDL